MVSDALNTHEVEPTPFDPWSVDPHLVSQDDAAYEDYLSECAAYFYDKPLKFIEWAFDWGVGELEGQTGPDKWQIEFFLLLAAEIEDRAFDGVHSVDPILMSVGSGHGIGKSAAVAWLILFLLFTRPFAKGTVTASTVKQLQTKTIPELKKWLRRSCIKHWFKSDTTKIVHVDHPENWRADFHTATKENSEAFAGQHANDATSFYVFDESSGVPDEIDTVAKGGLTDGEPMYFKFGNRTKKTGHFNRTFIDKTEARRWVSMTVDSRTAKMTNKRQLREWIEDYGIDSDFCRVRILGLDPKQDSDAYFDAAKIAEARVREALASTYAPLVLGVDVARFGSDRSVIAIRKGRDARTHQARVFRKYDTQQLGAEVVKAIIELKPMRVYVDGTGVGGGVVDYLNHNGYSHLVKEVQFGAAADDPKRYFNKRTEMYGRLRAAIHEGGLAIPDSEELAEELLVQQYVVKDESKFGAIKLIAKEDMRIATDGDSCDLSDAYALTYAEPLAAQVSADLSGGEAGGPAGGLEKAEWHPFDEVA